MNKKRYIRITQKGVPRLRSLDGAIKEITEAFKYAREGDAIVVRFLDLIDKEFNESTDFKN